MVHDHVYSKPWPFLMPSQWTSWLSSVWLTCLLRSLWMAHIHFNQKITFQAHQNWTEEPRSAKAQIPWHFIVCYEGLKHLRRCEVEDMKPTFNDGWAYREKNGTWLKDKLVISRLWTKRWVNDRHVLLLPHALVIFSKFFSMQTTQNSWEGHYVAHFAERKGTQRS